LIVIDSKDTLPKAFHTLTANNIYSAPVFDSTKAAYIGFLDLLDLVAFIVGLFDKESKRETDLYELLKQTEKFDTEHATRVAGLAMRNAVPPIQKGASLQRAMTIFSKTGAHRIAIVENGKIVAVLTQSALISWIQKNIKQIPEQIRGQKMKEIGKTCFKEVISVQFDKKAIEAFRLMAKYGIHGIAVVDETGCTLSNLSAKDLKVVQPNVLFTSLYKPCLEIVQLNRKKCIDAVFPSFCVTPNNSLEESINKLALLKVHRLYIEDEHRRPIGVISLGDVISMISVPPETSV